MAIVFQGSTALGDAISKLGESVAGTITDISTKRKEAKKKETFTTQLQEVIDQGGDVVEFIQQQSIKGGIPESIQKQVEFAYGPAIKEQAKSKGIASYLNQVLNEGQPAQETSDQGFQPIPNEQPIPTDPTPDRPQEFQTVGNENQLEIGSQLANASDNQLAKLTLNPQTAPLAKFEKNRRDEASKAFRDNRDFAFKKTKDFRDEMRANRKAQESMDYWLPMAAQAIADGKTNALSGANISRWTGMPEFQTTDGGLLATSAKNFLLSNIQGTKGRPNQWLEQQISGAFAQAGQDEFTSMIQLASLMGENEYKKEEVKVFNELEKENPNDPELESKFRERMEGRLDDIRLKTAYQIREIQEQAKGIDNLMNKKVPKNQVPLTAGMANAFLNKFEGDEKKALKHAKKLGYYIPSDEEYRRWLQ